MLYLQRDRGLVVGIHTGKMFGAEEGNDVALARHARIDPLIADGIEFLLAHLVQASSVSKRLPGRS